MDRNTNLMGEVDSSVANGPLASQEIPHGVWNLKLYCLVRRISQLVLTSARLIQFTSSYPILRRSHLLLSSHLTLF